MSEIFGHTPVLPDAVCEIFPPSRQEVIVDCTVGLGGHAEILLSRDPTLRIIGLDVDPANIETAGTRLGPFGDRIRLVQANFRGITTVLGRLGTGPVGGLLADLGASSNQIADPQRGLSFDLEGPLDMRLSPELPRTAADLVNALPEGELADLLYLQGGERHSRRIAKRVCQARRHGRITSTLMLARLVSAAVGPHGAARKSRLHPATRTFMALRMAVNAELESLRELLDQAPGCLRPQGRVAIISFHSGEDRLVKEDFRVRAREGVYTVLTRKPQTASPEEVAANPRSRSAKLRAAERIAAT